MKCEPLVVLCMKWGSLYPASYVNVLHSACRANLQQDFRFVCLANDTEGYEEGIEVFPIPDLGYQAEHWASGAWPKLSVFVDDLYGLRGRALFIDLDSVVLDDLAPFFEVPGDFVSIGGGVDWRRGNPNPNPTLASGVFSFTLGSQPQIAANFREDPMGAFHEFKLEQRFIEAHVSSWKPWAAEWVISFKRHLRRPVLVDRILPPRLPDDGTKIVAFHGDPRPIDVVRSDRSSWARFPRYGRGAISWVRKYWLDNGYRDPI
ncbi:hypothetical protein [Shimia abyssi]|uniref:Glycosyltransferase n=1 Tax=Shimia abyssi TaxID=1662395 RepID=A0A2P8FCC6_9RHOB|nr:hypothetical protein [Shimia abyssi]PSL19332.1 hypothetical protein CLV88_10644 [Shimia abyssi]